jgi:crotonobetainyl-CoA hydratase
VPKNELMSTAVGIAEKIIQCAPLAIQATKQAVMEGLNTSNLDELQQAQKDGQFDRLEVMLQSRDIKEGLTAFMEKRKPQWQAK